MKNERSGVILLLGLLLLLSTVIGALHASTPPTVATNKQEHNGNDQAVSTDHLMNLIQPLLISESVEKIVELLNNMPLTTQRTIIKRLDKDTELSKNNLFQILFGLAVALPDNAVHQNALFDLMLDGSIAHTPTTTPLFFLAAISSYPTIIPLLHAWAKRHAADHAWLKTAINDALMYAIQKNKPKALALLHKHGIPIDRPTATNLLWETVVQQKSPKIIRFLSSLNPDVNYAKDGYTILMKAVGTGNYSLVKTLLDTYPHLDTNKMLVPSIGTALQLVIDYEVAATKKNKKKKATAFINIEKLLRERGAQEQAQIKDQS
jgi:hypothetical protein